MMRWLPASDFGKIPMFTCRFQAIPEERIILAWGGLMTRGKFKLRQKFSFAVSEMEHKPQHFWHLT